MLKNLRLTDLRSFAEHFVPLRDLTVFVGQNNAGKSTIVEALRLISIVALRYGNLTYRPPPGKVFMQMGFK